MKNKIKDYLDAQTKIFSVWYLEQKIDRALYERIVLSNQYTRNVKQLEKLRKALNKIKPR